MPQAKNKERLAWKFQRIPAVPADQPENAEAIWSEIATRLKAIKINSIDDLWKGELVGGGLSNCFEMLQEICESKARKAPEGLKPRWLDLKISVQQAEKSYHRRIERVKQKSLPTNAPKKAVKEPALQPETKSNPREISLNYFQEKERFFDFPEGFFPPQILVMIDSKIPTTQKIKNIEFPNRKKPSLEEVHELYFEIREYEKSNPKEYRANITLFNNLKDDLNEYCKLQFHLNFNFAEENGIIRKIDNRRLGEGAAGNHIYSLLSKDPEIVARQLFKNQKKISGPNDKPSLDPEALTRALLENCTLEQSYSAAKIGQQLEKLYNSKRGKNNFKDNLRIFCKTFASLFLNKYRITNEHIAQTRSLLEHLSKSKAKNRISISDDSTSRVDISAKKVFGIFTEGISKATIALDNKSNKGR
ncbi:MAG: hypothetical protein K0Q51_1142 [Rickettsiaceae bacterium]|jgi:hypothetical protein|nr:hypothetical protein [Rickettsiaceae bacterium]